MFGEVCNKIKDFLKEENDVEISNFFREEERNIMDYELAILEGKYPDAMFFHHRGIKERPGAFDNGCDKWSCYIKCYCAQSWK